MNEHVFYRNLKAPLLKVDHGEGIYLYDTDGKKYIDACAGASVCNIGHGDKRVIDAMTKQASKVAFSHLSRWTSEPIEEVCDLVAELAPGDLSATYLVSGGSEATESALKMARQYFLERDGVSGKYKIIARRKAYHGNTIGSLSMTGDKRRQKYTPLLLDFPHIAPAYCYRCPFNQKPESCHCDCAWDLENTIKEHGADTVAGFIAETVGGAACGALVPPKDYFKIIRQICDHYDILYIDDEVMTGFGRTGKMFACDNWGVVPDLICAAKGMSSGYSPLGAVIARKGIYDTFKNGSGSFVHGHTYGGNPLTAAVSAAVIKVLRDDKLPENAAKVGPYLLEQLREKILPFWFVGDVRGIGLMLGVELVQSKATKEPFPLEKHISARLTQTLIKHGVIIYPGSGNAKNGQGDHFLLAPPLIITKDQVDELIEKMVAGFKEFEAELR